MLYKGIEKVIETTRLLIRKFRDDDWKDLYESLQEIYEFETGKPITQEEAKNIASERSREEDFLAVIY